MKFGLLGIGVVCENLAKSLVNRCANGRGHIDYLFCERRFHSVLMDTIYIPFRWFHPFQVFRLVFPVTPAAWRAVRSCK